MPGVGGMRSSAGRPGSGALYPGRDVLPPPNNALEPTAPMVAFTHAAVRTWRGGSPRAFGGPRGGGRAGGLYPKISGVERRREGLRTRARRRGGRWTLPGALGPGPRALGETRYPHRTTACTGHRGARFGCGTSGAVPLPGAGEAQR